MINLDETVRSYSEADEDEAPSRKRHPQVDDEEEDKPSRRRYRLKMMKRLKKAMMKAEPEKAIRIMKTIASLTTR